MELFFTLLMLFFKVDFEVNYPVLFLEQKKKAKKAGKNQKRSMYKIN